MQKKILRDYRFWTVLLCAGLFIALEIMNLLKVSVPTAEHGAASCAFIYAATALPFIIFFIFAAVSLKKNKALIYASLLFILSFLLRILYANFRSLDYVGFLADWMAEYRARSSVKECFTQLVGNYPPPYNYFLIAFSRLDIYDLYLIKTLSFWFETLTVFFAVKIICLVRKERFNYISAAVFLLLPIPLTNSSQWGQCDTMYTMCAVAGIYFALKCKCIPAYAFIGLGFAFKLQTLLIAPVGLVLLFARNADGKKFLLLRFFWLVPAVFFAANCLPVFFGGSLFKAFDVYFNQVTVGNAGQALNGHCANILLPFSAVPDKSVAYYILLVLFILITAITDIFIIYRTLKGTGKVLDARTVLFLCVLLPLNSVFFMPKMLDRFYYIAEIFLFVYFAVYRDKNSFTAYALLETAQWIMYTRGLLKINGLFIIAPLFSAFSLIIAYAAFIKRFPFENKSRLYGVTSKLNGLALLIIEGSSLLPLQDPSPADTDKKNA